MKITIKTVDGEIYAQAWSTKTPGLAIVKHDRYSLTHLGSGKALPGTFRTLRAARYCAEQLGDLANWERSEGEISPISQIAGLDDAFELAWAMEGL